ncbi:MucR family transcriptional regulator [Methylobacterium brachythecii]|uniref:Transcriptional regulator n=1 Tax=Methylobacterium brachythecii TaxID=1176177 RepID=A0A7W6F883_9HYPH|nr:MucR family transcriptional regulator [Methylobacterium brachythecii]MBB3904222.1 putative transcriptional regulator [Methylobacterium brachythecii]GLS45115.1 transcriptional regulator [Methylobacterium brachythecii]
MSESSNLYRLPLTDTGAHFDPTISIVGDIVSAYVSNNAVTAEALPSLIKSVHGTVTTLGQPSAPDAARPELSEKATPAQIRKSITPDALISFIDGASYKTLKRHLSTNGMTPASYRAQFGLPADYPMVAANYSAARSALAKGIGLGIRTAGEAQPAEPVAA